MSPTAPSRCPNCGGTDLIFGRPGLDTKTFLPRGKFTWSGYPVEAFVCAQCGYMGQFLSAEQLAKLKSRMGK